MKQKMIGRYIITDPDICHGKPTFRGTRIMVWQVLEQVANGLSSILSWATSQTNWKTQNLCYRSESYHSGRRRPYSTCS